MDSNIKQLKNNFDKSFLAKVFIIAVPIIIQNTITNLAGLLDNVMVGMIGTDQMNGVSVVNQLNFVYNLCVWGSICGAGIFTAQFYGRSDHQGVRYTFRAKIFLALLISVFIAVVYFFAGDFLINLFLHKTDNIGNPELTLLYGKNYLRICLIGFFPFSIAMSYSNTLRGIGETRIPMIGGIIGVAVNVCLNYILIFGKLGAPELGVEGAAVATVVSRFCEMFFIVAYTHIKKNRFEFIKGAFKSLKIPFDLLKKILIKGTPLAANECLWALGLTFLNQTYSFRGLAVVGALNITSTITNLFNVFLFAMGESISIIVGQLLGAGKKDESKSTAIKLIFLSASTCVLVALVLFLCRNFFPGIYNTEAEVKILASKFISVAACIMPVNAIVHCCYFTLRCGGKTFITFLFDSLFVWAVLVPLSFCLVHFTSLEILIVYAIVASSDILKAVIGVILVNRGIWIQQL